MINFEKLTRQELSRNGLTFRTEDEAQLFAEIIIEELEVRIGTEICSRLSDEELEEFDNCVESLEAQEWLRAHLPHYREIVLQKKEELDQEIRKYRSQIPGLI